MSETAQLLTPVEATRLVRQSFGIAMAQGRFGGPRGVWLNCTTCERSEVIVGSAHGETVDNSTPDSHCAAIFRHHGWTGEGDKMMKARCPACASAPSPGKRGGDGCP